MKVYKQELQTGLKNQEIVLPIINKYFNRIINNTKGQYNRYDYEDELYKYELKSRTNKYDLYPTTLIGLDKVDNNTIFLFYFTDGLYYIEYNKELFDTFDIKDFVRNQRYGKVDKPKKYIYIPIDKLKLIEFI
jgi:hypothetical protein